MLTFQSVGEIFDALRVIAQLECVYRFQLQKYLNDLKAIAQFVNQHHLQEGELQKSGGMCVEICSV